MDDARVGGALRAIRIRKRLRQKDLACRAKVSRTLLGRVEHGRLTNIGPKAHLLDRWQGRPRANHRQGHP